MAWNSIPVLAYHQVRPGGLVTPEGFGAHLAVMRDGGWQTCFLDEVVAFVRGERTPSARTVAITFDDGYLDNWVHAFPLLTKHNAKATVFVITARPHDGSPRPKAADCPPLDEAQRDAVRAGGPSAHFCNWQELKAMADSGLVQVQSHGHEHRACFAEPTVLRLNRGRESWALPTMTDGDERGGIPVYPWRSALAACRYADSPELRDEAVRRLSEGQSEAEIVADLNRRLLTDALGRSETPAEREQRVLNDLATSRRLVADHVGVEPRHFCYPWGQHDEALRSFVSRAGFTSACTLARGGNYPGVDLLQLRRIDVRTSSPDWLARRLFVYSGRRRSKLYVWFYRLGKRHGHEVPTASSELR